MKAVNLIPSDAKRSLPGGGSSLPQGPGAVLLGLLAVGLALVTVYVLLVAPEIATQFAPFESHCCHWYVCVAGEPENVPSCSVSTWPIRAVPVIVGSAVLTGGVTIPATTPVGPEVAGTDPPPFVAVILTRSVCP